MPIAGMWRGIYVENGYICGHIAVPSDDPSLPGAEREYKACIPFDDAFKALSNFQKRQAIAAAIAAVREAHFKQTQDPTITASGNVSI